MTTQDVVDIWERKLVERGVKKGELRATRSMLVRQLRVRFGAIDANVQARINKAPKADLERWAERVVLAERVRDVFTA